MARFNRFVYNTKDFEPITNYKAIQIPSLDVSLEPVLSDIPNLQHYLENAKSLCRKSSKHGLTLDESAAIYLYTTDWGSQSLHCVLNQALQSGDQDLLYPWLAFFKLLNTALEKLPPYQDKIWLGLPVDIAKKLKNNEKLVVHSITSCCSSPHIMNKLLDENSVLCSIKSSSARNIHEYRPSENKQEVLLLPGACLYVKSKPSSNKKNKLAIELQEINHIDDSKPISHHKKQKKTNAGRLQREPSAAINRANNKSVPHEDASEKNLIKAIITFVNGDICRVRYKNGKRQDYCSYQSIDGKNSRMKMPGVKLMGKEYVLFRMVINL